MEPECLQGPCCVPVMPKGVLLRGGGPHVTLLLSVPYLLLGVSPHALPHTHRSATSSTACTRAVRRAASDLSSLLTPVLSADSGKHPEPQGLLRLPCLPKQPVLRLRAPGRSPGTGCMETQMVGSFCPWC